MEAVAQGRIQITPDECFGDFQRSIQRALDLASVSLRGTPAGGGRPYLDAPLPVFIGSRVADDEVGELHSAWIKGHLLSDLIEALEPLVDCVFRCAVFSEAKAPFSSAAEAGEFLKRFENPPAAGKPIGNKLTALRAEFPTVLSQDLYDAIDPLRRLRNCLTHGGGVVRTRDCDVNGDLRVDGTLWEMVFQPSSGGLTVPVEAGFTAPEDGTIGMRRRSVPILWRVGQRVTVSEADLLCIAFTLYWLACDLRSNLYVLLRDRGKLPAGFLPKAPNIEVHARMLLPGSPHASGSEL